jgi:hypothetical protein
MNSQFTIPKPCHENWSAMTPNEQGRFCSQCSKSVTDFTQMSNDEIIIYLKTNKNFQVCGRFRNDQLEEKTLVSIPKKVLYSQTKFINIFLLALLVTMGSMLFSCKEEDHVVGEIAEMPQDTVALPPPPLPERKELHTMGMVAYPRDSVAHPQFNDPNGSDKQIPKSTNN